MTTRHGCGYRSRRRVAVTPRPNRLWPATSTQLSSPTHRWTDRSSSTWLTSSALRLSSTTSFSTPSLTPLSAPPLSSTSTPPGNMTPLVFPTLTVFSITRVSWPARLIECLTSSGANGKGCWLWLFIQVNEDGISYVFIKVNEEISSYPSFLRKHIWCYNNPLFQKVGKVLQGEC